MSFKQTYDAGGKTINKPPRPPAPTCPVCGSNVWDNVHSKVNPRGPDLKCRGNGTKEVEGKQVKVECDWAWWGYKPKADAEQSNRSAQPMDDDMPF